MGRIVRRHAAVHWKTRKESVGELLQIKEYRNQLEEEYCRKRKAREKRITKICDVLIILCCLWALRCFVCIFV